MTEPTNVVNEIRRAADNFRAYWWPVLEGMNIVPRPAHQPFMSVGTDWYGPDINTHATHSALESTIERAFPARFENEGLRNQEFASSYSHHLVELTAAYETSSTSLSEASNRAVQDIVDFLREPRPIVRTCRFVANLRVDEPVVLDSLGCEIHPVSRWGWVDAGDLTGLPGLRQPKLWLGLPTDHCVISCDSEHVPGESFMENMSVSHDRITKVVRQLRLLKRGAIRETEEYFGFLQPGSSVAPLQFSWPDPNRHQRPRYAEAEQSWQLTQTDVERLRSLGTRYDQIVTALLKKVSDRSLAYSGVISGMQNFDRSFVDDGLATLAPQLMGTLEGLMTPEDASEAIVFRLRSRLCLLLATDGDSSDYIFEKIGLLYNHRSLIQHSADIKETKLGTTLKKILDTDSEMQGTNEALSAELLREIARRAILMRLILATCDTAEWPIESDEPPDRMLLSPDSRKTWRDTLRQADTDLDLGLFDPLALAVGRP